MGSNVIIKYVMICSGFFAACYSYMGVCTYKITTPNKVNLTH